MTRERKENERKKTTEQEKMKEVTYEGKECERRKNRRIKKKTIKVPILLTLITSHEALQV